MQVDSSQQSQPKLSDNCWHEFALLWWHWICYSHTTSKICTTHLLGISFCVYDHSSLTDLASNHTIITTCRSEPGYSYLDTLVDLGPLLPNSGESITFSGTLFISCH